MCGGTMEMTNESIAVCEYCGTQQTVPTVQDSNLQGLFNRANSLRIKCEFDKAEQLYEKIISIDNTLAEAYWGLILCKYGIEYVEDPKTFKRIPTCHRTSFDSIIADEDYNCAIDFADSASQKLYVAEAKEIDRLQKEILALSQKENPYDVFICYKETDEIGERTKDSAIANDIYYQLTQEGFKVFYAAITLEDKLGSAYEPCIFAALNSSKVMLAIGTKPEHFNAVWVKNEWSRFLKMMKNDRSKLLIPCYLDMDAYELPDEFAHLQAQDMSKIGFINDVVRGIKKIIVREDASPAAVAETIVTNTNTNINTAPLIERVFMFLEDGEWDSANEYCEKVLDQEPKNAQAYLGKLMAELKVKEQSELIQLEEPFDNNNNYTKIIRFGDNDIISFIENCTTTIKERKETHRKTLIYTNAKNIFDTTKSEEEFLKAAKLFESISGFKNADEMSKQAFEKADSLKRKRIYAQNEDIYIKAITYCNHGNEEEITQGLSLLESIRGFKDADEQLANKDMFYANISQKKIYVEALRKLNLAEQNIRDNIFIQQTSKSLVEIKELFSSIIDWRDSRQKAELCDKFIIQCQKLIEKNALESELKSLKGLFTSKERAKLQEAINKIDQEINDLK